MQEVKQQLQSQFKMKDLGKLHYCLGIMISDDQTNKVIEMHQKQYILLMLEKYGLLDAKSVSTPADLNVKLCKDDEVSKPVNSMMYQSMVESLLYVAVADISQAVGTVSKFNSSPSEAHLTAVKRILHYLKGTLDVTLKFKKTDDDKLIGFSDADYAGDLDDRRSTSENVFLMSSGPVSRFSKKQAIVTLSTAEYAALSIAAQETMWIKKASVRSHSSTRRTIKELYVLLRILFHIRGQSTSMSAIIT